MGQEAEKEQRIKTFMPYQVNTELFSKAKNDAIFLHCLPAYRDYEVTEEVIDGPQSVIFDEAENRLHVQKAIIPVGTVRVELLPDGTAYVSRFGVSLQYHNIGIGKSLMNLVDKWVGAKGIKKVSLHTASKYKDLIRFYYGRGFYVASTSTDRGYIRALLVKEY